MSELDKREMDSKKATAGLGAILLTAIVGGIKFLYKINKSGLEDSFRKLDSESQLEREKNRPYWEKPFHIKERIKAEEKYKKYH